uniref:EB domain-containing protein n=1 Tax=Steinernema glaseri TaxID=37863 RepID=A0A1I7XYW9_9BILA
MCLKKPDVTPGRSCLEGDICLGGAQCEQGRCVCGPDAILVRNECIRGAK